MSALLPLGRLCVIGALASAHLFASASTTDSGTQPKSGSATVSQRAPASTDSYEADTVFLILAGVAAVYFVARRRLRHH